MDESFESGEISLCTDGESQTPSKIYSTKIYCNKYQYIAIYYLLLTVRNIFIILL